MSFERLEQSEVTLNYDNLEAIPIEYSLPFSWGSVHVSEAANFAYDLQPVNGSSIGNYSEIPIRSKSDPEVTVWILASGEVTDPRDLPSAVTVDDSEDMPLVQGLLPVSMWATQDSKKINVFTSFPNSSLAREEIFNGLREQIGVDHEDASFGFDGSDSVEAAKEVDQILSQSFIHVACDFIEQNLPQYFLSHYRERDIKRQIRSVTALGAVGAVGAGYTAAGGPSTLMTGVAAASYGLATTYFQRQELKRYFLKKAALHEASRAIMAQNSAARISREIHDAYCANGL